MAVKRGVLSASRGGKNLLLEILQLTYDEQDLHRDVADGGAAGYVVVITDEAHVVGHCHGHVEGGEQDQPIPAGFEGAVVKQDELGLLGVCYLVLRQSGRVPEHVLDGTG